MRLHNVDPAEVVAARHGGLAELLAALGHRRPDWWARAACAGHPTDWWFPSNGAGPDSDVVRRAVRICGRCPVQDRCLADAIAHGDDGVRAGLTGKQRRALGRAV